MEFVEESDRFSLYDETQEHKKIGEMTWIDKGDYFVIDHTYVSSAYRGQRLAEQFIAKGVEKARRENRKIFPTCPYAVKVFAKKSDYRDILKEESE